MNIHPRPRCESARAAYAPVRWSICLKKFLSTACSGECPSHRGGCGQFSVRGPCPGRFWNSIPHKINGFSFEARSGFRFRFFPVAPGRSISFPERREFLVSNRFHVFAPGRSRSLPNLFLFMCTPLEFYQFCDQIDGQYPFHLSG